MKITLADRIILILLGLLLLAGGAFLLYSQIVWGQELQLGTIVSFSGIPGLVSGMLIALLGLYLLTVAFRREGKTGFVLQKTENGNMNISVKALEALVRKCTDHHQELQVERLHLTDTRDGLMIHLRVAMSAGLNIPLVISTLQKQIKQYVTACSGVDVKAVQVQVNHTAEPVKSSPYVVSELLAEGPKKEALPPPAEQQVHAPAPAAPVVTQVAPQPAAELEDTADDRPFHQRLFSRGDEPMTVPAPPVNESADVEKDAGNEEGSSDPEPVVTAPEENKEEESTPSESDADQEEKGTQELVTRPLALSLEDALKNEDAAQNS